MSFKNTSGVTTTKTLSYDSVGNPLNYYNGTMWVFTWKNGRQLESAHCGNYANPFSYSYDVDGVRQAKTVNGVTHSYTTLNGKIVRETYSGKTTVKGWFSKLFK